MRRPDEHLDPHELSVLAGGSVPAGDLGEDVAEAEQHLAACPECSDLLATLRSARALAPSRPPLASCPSTELWGDWVCGEELPPAQLNSLLDHASRCARCARELRSAMTWKKAMDESDAAAGVPPGSASSTLGWEEAPGTLLSEVNRTLARTAGPPAPPVSAAPIPFPSRRSHVFRFAAVAATALLAAGAALGGWWWTTAHNPTHLLAESYNRQRLTELRIPGGSAVPLASFTRAAGQSPEDPAVLDELRATVERKLEADPSSGYWRQIRGRIRLLEANPSAALTDFNTAQSESASPLPGIDADLGDAWFEAGEETGNPVNYARAAEFFSRQLRVDLQNSPRNASRNAAVLYYNRALCWDRQGLRQNALDDYRAALAAESSPEWRKAIQARIDALSHTAQGPAGDGYEAALAAWVPARLAEWDASPASKAALEKLAAHGMTHHDAWLQDWLRGPHTPQSRQADTLLAQAAAAGRAAHPEELLSTAVLAQQRARQAGSRAAEFRARQLEVYALQRLVRSAECSQRATALLADPGLAAYATLRLQVLLDAGACAARQQDMAEAGRLMRQAQAAGEAAGLPDYTLRSTSSLAELATVTGRFTEAWQQDVQGLALCARLHCGPRSEYPLLYNMAQIASGQDERLIAALLMRSAVADAASNSVASRAYAVETLAAIEGAAGDAAGATRDFQQAYTLAQKSVPPLYLAAWHVDEAGVLARGGHPAESLRLLKDTQPVVLASDYSAARVGFYQHLSRSELDLGQTDAALADAQHAVAEAETALRSLHTPFEREDWSRRNAEVYLNLVAIRLRRNENDAALAEWERFRSLPYSRPQPLPAASIAPASTPAVLVLARVGDRYIGWRAHAQPLVAERTVVLGDAPAIDQRVRAFYRLCADPHSSLVDVRSVGEGLYRTLLAPLVAEGDQHLWLDVDSGLTALPFEALWHQQRWLGQSVALTELAPWWTLNGVSALKDEPLHATLRTVVLEGFAGQQAQHSEAAEVAAAFPSAQLVHAQQSSADQILHDLDAAELFHYSGHAATGQRAALLGPSTAPDEAITPHMLASRHLGCRIAVLAACNTRAADPDAPGHSTDLSSALLEAGAHTVIASRWDVDNDSTRALMHTFYAQASGNAGASSALQRAETSVAAAQAWLHPYFWAPFTTISQ